MVWLAGSRDSAERAAPQPAEPPIAVPGEGAPPAGQRVRISDADRDRVLSELKQRYAEGRLSSDTFMGRLDATLAARYHEELDAQLADLPRRRRLPDVIRAAAARLTAPAHSIVAAVAATRSARSIGMARPTGVARPSGVGRPSGVARPSGSTRAELAQRMPELVLPPGRQAGFTIGRDMACDFTVADLSVSRSHARLHRQDGGWQLSDLGSTNGTRVNGWRVTTNVPVEPGDSVSFGSVTFVITDRPIAARAGPADS